jgi:hypothetical protein
MVWDSEGGCWQAGARDGWHHFFVHWHDHGKAAGPKSTDKVAKCWQLMRTAGKQKALVTQVDDQWIF